MGKDLAMFDCNFKFSFFGKLYMLPIPAGEVWGVKKNENESIFGGFILGARRTNKKKQTVRKKLENVSNS